MEYLGVEKPVNKINPLVSVCVVTYNHAFFIGQCLDGILMQKTNFPYEIIVGEDNSRDGTREICREYAKNYPGKIRLFLRKEEEKIFIDGHPTGKLNTLNTQNAARGKYIAICDGDDYWTDPEKIQKQVDFLEKNPEYVLAFHDGRAVDEHDHYLSTGGLPLNLKKDGTGVDLIAGKWLPTLTVMFRNLLPKQMPVEYFKALNGDAFIYTLLGHYGGAKYIEGIKPAHYRQHAGGIWSALNQREKYEQMLNTRKLLLKVVDNRYRWAVKQTVFTNSIFLAPYMSGISPKIKQYLSAYMYFEFSAGFLKIFFKTHFILIRKALGKITRKVLSFGRAQKSFHNELAAK